MLTINPPGKNDLVHLKVREGTPYRVLIVDDDSDVLASTRIALRNSGTALDGRDIVIEDAVSEADARARLAGGCYALAVVDVVMERPDAGLTFVDWVRKNHGDGLMRMALRTGNPGSASELAVLREHDISDYRPKSLTGTQFTTLVRGHVRNYRDIVTHATDAWLNGRIALAMHAVVAGAGREQALAGMAGEVCEPAGTREIAVTWLDAATAASVFAGGGYRFAADRTSCEVATPATGIRIEGACAANAAIARALALAAEGLAQLDAGAGQNPV